MKQAYVFPLHDLPVLLLAAGISVATPAHSATPDIQFGIGVSHDDNVTRTMNGGNKYSDQSLNITLGLPVVIPISEHFRAILTGTLAMEHYLGLDKLSNVSGKAQGEIQYRSSAEFGTPTYGLFARQAIVEYQSGQRDGMLHASGISIRKTFTDRISAYGMVSHNERNGHNEVFKNKYDAVLLNLDYDVKATGTLYLGGEYRRGDMAISAPRWNWYTSDITRDDAFSGWSYRVRGDTRILKLGFNLPLGRKSSLDLSWNMAESSATYRTQTWNKSAASYTANQYSAAWLLRF